MNGIPFDWNRLEYRLKYVGILSSIYRPPQILHHIFRSIFDNIRIRVQLPSREFREGHFNFVSHSMRRTQVNCVTAISLICRTDTNINLHNSHISIWSNVRNAILVPTGNAISLWCYCFFFLYFPVDKICRFNIVTYIGRWTNIFQFRFCSLVVLVFVYVLTGSRTHAQRTPYCILRNQAFAIVTIKILCHFVQFTVAPMRCNNGVHQINESWHIGRPRLCLCYHIRMSAFD